MEIETKPSRSGGKKQGGKKSKDRDGSDIIPRGSAGVVGLTSAKEKGVDGVRHKRQPNPKGTFNKWIEPQNLVWLEGMARDGLSLEKIAERIGVACNTLKMWKREIPQIRTALALGREPFIHSIEKRLGAIAHGGKGNVAACIFILKNYAPHKWRDRHDVDVGGEVLTPVQVTFQEYDASVPKAETVTEAVNADS